MEIGNIYYVLGLTPKVDFQSQHTEHFPIIDGDRYERIPPGAKALQVFADYKRALECLEREMPERANEFIRATGKEIRDFSIGYSSRQEVKDIASKEGAAYVIVEDADGSFTLEALSE